MTVFFAPQVVVPPVVAQVGPASPPPASPPASPAAQPAASPAVDSFVRGAHARRQAQWTAQLAAPQGRTLADLDRRVVDFARAQMGAVGSGSAAFQGTSDLLAAEGMSTLGRAGQIELLRAVRARPEDKRYHVNLRHLVRNRGFQALDARARTQVVDAFAKMPNASAAALLDGLSKTRGDARMHLLEQVSTPEFAALDAHAQAHDIAHTVARETAPSAPATPGGKPGELQVVMEKTWRSGHRVSHYVVDGVTFKIAEHGGDAKVDRAQLPKMAKAINEANALIADPARQVHDVAIHNNASRMATYEGKPILLLNYADANAGVATHEAGHVVFDAMIKSFKAPAGLDLQVADIYQRLSDTRAVTAKTRATDGTRTVADYPAGLWPFDPSQWSKKLDSEHPWENTHEFFASALRAYKTDRKGLEASIARFAKKDPAAAAPAQEMLKLLDDLHAGSFSPATLSTDAAKNARGLIDRVRATPTVESTLESMHNDLLRHALMPEAYGAR